ncbi:hypothetical protein ACG9ZB_07520 [Acinetobacter johnsonii]|uniref:hypothetical protein n=1 Tax=Acinetobacter johnsonii TaxID=40214 RepID=UPI003AF71E93
MKLKSPKFWVYLAVNLYLISMLVFVTVECFGGADSAKISAFGSVLGGVGAFFAGIIAIYLFSDWRLVKKYELEKETSLVLLNSILNINSTIESLLSLADQFRDLNSLDNEQIAQFSKWCDDYSLSFLQNLTEIKSQNNLHHALVRDFEKDTKLFSKEDLMLFTNIFDQLGGNIETIFLNYKNKTLDAKSASVELSQIDMTEYGKMIRTKIVLLKKECKPL